MGGFNPTLVRLQRIRLRRIRWRLRGFQSHTGPASTGAPDEIPEGAFLFCFNPTLVRLQPALRSEKLDAASTGFNPTLVRLQPDRAHPRIPARGPSTSPLESSIYKGSWSRNIAPMGLIRQEMGDRGDRAVSSRFARRASTGPGIAGARRAPGFRGVTVRAGERSSQGLRHAHTSAT